MGFVSRHPTRGSTLPRPVWVDWRELMGIVLVVRHAHAEGNADHRFIGQSDVPLDALGRTQTATLTERLSTLPITHIVCSDLQRAIDTVEPTASRLDLVIERDVRLREINNGAWTGLLPGEIAAGWPDLWDSYINGADVRRPDGETWLEVRQRAIEAVEEHGAHEGLVLICTHGGPALNLAAWAAGLPVGGNIFGGRLAALANTAITTVELPGPRLVGFNDVGHLAGFVPDIRRPFERIDG